MRRHFLHGMKGTGNHVEGEPGEQQPTGPIVAEQKERAAEHGKKADGGDENDITFEWPMREVISKAYAAREDEQYAENRDWPRSLHRGKRILRGEETAVHQRRGEANDLRRTPPKNCRFIQCYFCLGASCTSTVTRIQG